MQIHGYCQCSIIQSRRFSYILYRLPSCRSVSPRRREPDLILIALAGRVCNVLGLHRPRSKRSPRYVSSHIHAFVVHSWSRNCPRWINSIVNLSAAGESATRYVSRTKTQGYIFCCRTLVMLYYDYLLTLPREIEYLWPPHNKQGWFTLACLLNRYLPVIGLSPIAASYFFPVTSAVRSSSMISQVSRI